MSYNSRQEDGFSALRGYFLMAEWPTRGWGLGQIIFFIGKGIGILGRIATVSILTGALVGCFVEPQLLMIVAYSGGIFVFAAVATEVVARTLMLAGNWLVLRFGGEE